MGETVSCQAWKDKRLCVVYHLGPLTRLYCGLAGSPVSRKQEKNSERKTSPIWSLLLV